MNLQDPNCHLYMHLNTNEGMIRMWVKILSIYSNRLEEEEIRNILLLIEALEKYHLRSLEVHEIIKKIKKIPGKINRYENERLSRENPELKDLLEKYDFETQKLKTMMQTAKTEKQKKQLKKQEKIFLELREKVNQKVTFF